MFAFAGGLLKNCRCKLLKKPQRRGARSSHMADSLWHIIGPIRYKPYAISQPEVSCLPATA